MFFIKIFVEKYKNVFTLKKLVLISFYLWLDLVKRCYSIT